MKRAYTGTITMYNPFTGLSNASTQQQGHLFLIGPLNILKGRCCGASKIAFSHILSCRNGAADFIFLSMNEIMTTFIEIVMKCQKIYLDSDEVPCSSTA